MNKPDDIVLCHEFSSDADARMAQAILSQEGIKSILDNETFSRIYPIGFNSLGGIRLMVRAADLSRATILLHLMKLPD